MNISSLLSTPRIALAVSLCALGLGVAPSAHAQDNRGGFQASQWRPMPSITENYFQVSSANTLVSGDFEVGFILHYARNPLVVTLDGNRISQVLTDQLTGDLHGAVGITDWLELGLDLPLYFLQERGITNQIGGVTPEDVPAGIGDLRIVPRLYLGHAGNFHFGLLADLAVPTATNENAYQGEGVRAEPRFSVEYRRERFRLAGNVGYFIRPATTAANIGVDDTLQIGMAAEIDVYDSRVFVVPETVAGFADLGDVDISEVPFELRGGIKYYPIPAMLLHGGFGAGLIEGFGTPDFRTWLGISYSPVGCEQKDDDGDGVNNCDDVCPDFPDNEDRDADGIPDGCDPCPDTPGRECTCEPSGPQDDLDNDGRSDTRRTPEGQPCDLCPPDPDHPERDCNDDLDGDGDGIPDGCDMCLNGPDDIDTDDDCIPDACDMCPEDPETWGIGELEGCPATCDAERLLRMDADVLFEFDRDQLNETYSGYGEELLDQAAVLIILTAANLPDYERLEEVQVVGHTDSWGSDTYNADLSERRAESVLQGLVARGVDPSLLSVLAMGESELLCARTDAEWNAQDHIRMPADGPPCVESQEPGPPRGNGDTEDPANRANRRVEIRFITSCEINRRGETPPCHQNAREVEEPPASMLEEEPQEQEQAPIDGWRNPYAN